MGKTPNIDGHFGCNSNGEHEWCERCLLTDCRIRNTIWFGKKVTTAETSAAKHSTKEWTPCLRK